MTLYGNLRRHVNITVTAKLQSNKFISSERRRKRPFFNVKENFFNWPLSFKCASKISETRKTVIAIFMRVFIAPVRHSVTLIIYNSKEGARYMSGDVILSGIEQAMEIEPIRQIKPLPIDRWLAASCLQKAVRRGDEKTALRSALTLWMQDRRSFWRRLALAISVEDIGVASPGAVVQTLTAFNNPAWRAQHDDLKVGLYLTRLLCRATKIRLADEIYSIASCAPEYETYRERLAKADDMTLADITLHDKTPLPERAMALWFLAGTKRYPADNMPLRTGSLESVADVLRDLKAPADLTQCCIDTLNKTQWPLALWQPLLWVETQKTKRSILTWVEPLASGTAVKGIPLCALDQFTRTGLSCFRELKKSLPDLKPFSPRQIGLGVFYLEGAKVDKLLTSERLEDYRQAGEIADVEGAGLDIPRYLAMKEILIDHTDMLQAIRLNQLRAYLDKAQGELAFDGGSV